MTQLTKLFIFLAQEVNTTSTDSGSTSSTISTKAMRDIVDKLKLDRHRSSTKNTYYVIWKCFNKFLIRLDHKPKTWEERLTLYMAFLVDNKRKSSTINSYVSAIKAVLFDDGEILNEDRLLLASLSNACKRNNDRIRTRLPICKNMLNLLISVLPEMFGSEQPYLVTLYRALFATAYYGLFRVGELTISQHVVKVADVHIGINKKKLLFVLRSSKTHGLNVKPQMVKISSTANCNSTVQKDGMKHYCPFVLLQDYITVRKGMKSKSEPFFVFFDRTPVTANHFRKLLKATIKAVGLNEALYSCHSLRGGRAVDLFSMKVSVQSIMALGRWRSSSVYEYLKY